MSKKQGMEMIKMILKRMKETKGFDRCMDKVEIISAGDGRCTAEFTVSPEHQNAGGSLHGGFSATLVDMISTYALMTQGRNVPGVSVDMHLSYMKAAFEGEVVVVDAKTVKSGKTLAFLNVELKEKKTGKLLVTGSHTKFIG